MKIVLVTGLAGAGKSTALRALEDVDFFCVDNIPLPLLQNLIECVEGDVEKLAVAIDARQRMYLDQYPACKATLESLGHELEVLYLEADDDILMQRYSATRRSHPMSGDDVREGIQSDRKVLEQLRDSATFLDTTALNVHQLKGIIQERFGATAGKLSITLLSFGFKHGVPKEANLVFDVRFLPNPYFESHLSKLDGRESRVAEYVLESDEGKETLTRIKDFLMFSCPHYEDEGKRYLTIAVGCTGGRHRSVATVEALATFLESRWNVRVRHRDLTRSADG